MGVLPALLRTSKIHISWVRPDAFHRVRLIIICSYYRMYGHTSIQICFRGSHLIMLFEYHHYYSGVGVITSFEVYYDLP